MAAKFLTFIDAADDAATYPVDRLLGITVAGDATVLVKFESSIGSFGTDGAAADIVTLTITADKEKDVMKLSLMEKILYSLFATTWLQSLHTLTFYLALLLLTHNS